MPPKKKKGKASKFARMSDEERVRYLQHRAELELEAKRRKQQLIAAYSKLKLKREEVFSRLNNAKINEQWRFILRKIKCKELYDGTKYLWQNFDRTIQAKDAVICNLYEQLELADLDHGRLQKAHMDAIDILIDQSKERVDFFKTIYMNELDEIRCKDITDMNNVREQVIDSNIYLKTVVITQERNIEEHLAKAKTENAIKTLTLKISFEEEMANVKLEVGLKIKDLWMQLDRVISDYRMNTDSQRKQYEYLKELDDSCRLEIARFPKIQSQLQDTVETLKNELEVLHEERKAQNSELKRQVDLLNSRVSELRQEIKTSQATDVIQLKCLSVVSSNTINKLKEIVEKGSTLRMLMNLCLELELSLNVNKFPDQDKDILQQMARLSTNEPFDVMHKFWDQFNHVKAENVLMKKERSKLMAENIRIQHALKSYFVDVSNAPSIRTCT